MLGAQIQEGRGKRTGRRVVATDPHFKIEATAEEVTTLLGLTGGSIITYTSCVKPDGSVHGEGEAVFSTLEGDMVTWKGIGVGRFGEGGAINYCGSVSFNTSSPKLLKLNGVSGIFQWEIDAQGNTHSKMHEMTPASATKSAGA